MALSDRRPVRGAVFAGRLTPQGSAWLLTVTRVRKNRQGLPTSCTLIGVADVSVEARVRCDKDGLLSGPNWRRITAKDIKTLEQIEEERRAREQAEDEPVGAQRDGEGGEGALRGGAPAGQADT